MKILKPLRVVVAVIFMLFTTLLFLHFNSFLKIPDISVILELQYIPSLLKFLQGVTWIAFGFVVFTLLALLFGRIYCSFICPLGILQDFFIRVNRLLSKRNKNRYSYHQSLKWLRHLITGIALVSLILGSTSLLIWLDPYSHFGRMATHLLQPIYYFGNNGLALIVNHLGYYGIYRIEVHTFHWATFLFASFILVLLLALTRIKGRFFCNSLCPVGGFLSWISKVSIFRLAFEPSKCISCSRCEKACKAESIDYKNMKIDFDRCVACYNCVDTCFSSRRRHTILVSDWSSDVCSSDLRAHVCFSSRRRHTRLVSDWSSDVCSFFSSRRRHTRLVSDWSSDVCSSD